MENLVSRRNFLKNIGIGTASLPLVACSKKEEKQKKGAMTLRTTPTTKDKVSLLGFGCLRWPTKDGKAENNGNAEIDQEGVNKLVDYAIANGLNYFDTAPTYCQGKSEEVTGIALSRHPRNKYFIATKMSNFGQATWKREEALKMYHNSFKRLRVDYIDYMLLHSVGGGNGLPHFNQRFVDNGILEFLMKEREAGRIRNLGFSFHGDTKVFDYLLSKQDVYKWDFVQIQLNYLDWKHANAKYLYEELAKRNIPAVIMAPILGGRLVAIPHTLVPEYKRREPEKSMASWALRFAGSFPNVLTVLSAMTKVEHLAENIDNFSPIKPLSQDDFAFLDKMADKIKEYKNIPCNDCKYCMPCPYGLDIPSILLHYNKCQNEKLIPESRTSEIYQKARRAFLIGYDRSVPKLRGASQCTGCNECSKHCPQRVDIPREMRIIDNYVKNLKREGVLMGDVKKAFATGKYTLVIGNGEIYTYNNRGVKDLLEIYNDNRRLLKGALVADKVVGRAAASIYILGGITELYVGVIARSAMQMLRNARIKVEAKKVVDYIQNRTKDGMCPIETSCKDARTPQECLIAITKKSAELQGK